WRERAGSSVRQTRIHAPWRAARIRRLRPRRRAISGPFRKSTSTAPPVHDPAAIRLRRSRHSPPLRSVQTTKKASFTLSTLGCVATAESEESFRGPRHLLPPSLETAPYTASAAAPWSQTAITFLPCAATSACWASELPSLRFTAQLF